MRDTSLSQKKAHLMEIQVNSGSVTDEVDCSTSWKKKTLRLDLLCPEFHKLKSFFKNVLVSYKHMKARYGLSSAYTHH